jgi:hypothetical protein
MKKKDLIITCAIGVVCSFCFGQGGTALLYSSKAFSIYGDRVIQGKYQSVVESENKLVSNYQSPANANFNPEISFKYSINGRDNEAPSGQDHRAIICGLKDGPIVISTVFGEKDSAIINGDNVRKSVPANTPVHFEVDMRKVLEAFEKDGFYTDFSGNKIYKSDFKGLWIAGGSAPLSWDFENLPSREQAHLTDPDGDGIFSVDIVFNVYDPNSFTATEKILNKDVSKYPSLSSPFPLINAMYRLSLEEMMLDIRSDSAFMAGKEWTGVWTRDISYSIILSMAMLEPEIAKNSLMRKVKNKRIIQDTGTGGSWPVSTDREVWALAAWEIFKTTGDAVWLKQAYEIISNSINDDLKVAFNPSTGLFYGESSFLDWRKQTYPLWMEPVDIYRSQNLGTNAVFYKTLSILGEMGVLLGSENNYKKNADDLAKAINTNLWLADKNYYGQYLYGRYNYSLSTRSEALGEALCVLFNIADQERKEKVMSSVPVMEFGTPCIYPQIPGIPPYHNNAVWPFVEAYWTWAAARSGNNAFVEHGMADVYRQAALFLTNKENMVAENGDFKGTEINSDYQLWSVAANLSMVYRILFGIEMDASKILFQPFVPKNYAGVYELKGFKYRQSVLDIKVEKYGDGVAVFELDGKQITGTTLPAGLKGKHQVRIVMNEKADAKTINLVENYFSPNTPELSIVSGQLRWNEIKGAAKYRIVKNSKIVIELTNTSYDVSTNTSAEYQVQAVDANGVGSFLSAPVCVSASESEIKVEAEQFAQASTMSVFGFWGKGFVEFNKESPVYTFEINAEKDGNYIVEFRYANGNGPINTNNKCAIRSLYSDGNYEGSVVFPQRGVDEWSNWGISNPLRVALKKGSNHFELRFNDFNNNMNVDVNSFLLDQIICRPE